MKIPLTGTGQRKTFGNMLLLVKKISWLRNVIEYRQHVLVESMQRNYAGLSLSTIKTVKIYDI